MADILDIQNHAETGVASTDFAWSNFTTKTAGDWVIFFVSASPADGDDAVALNTPSGATKEEENGITEGDRGQTAVYSFELAGTESGSLTFDSTSVFNRNWNIQAVLVQNTDGVDGTSINASIQNLTTTESAPTVTVTNDSSLSISCVHSGTDGDPYTLPSGFTAPTEGDGAVHEAAFMHAEIAEAAVDSGATGAVTWTATSSDRLRCAQVVMLPSSGGGGFQSAWAKHSNQVIQ